MGTIKQLFTYWEGSKPPIISFCIKTIMEKAGVKVIVLTPDIVDKYIQGKLNLRFKRLKNIAQKVDCIRIAVLYNYGGMWCDADTIFLSSCEHLFDNDFDFVGMRWKVNHNILNGYFLSKASGLFLERCLESINEDLSDNPKHYYPEMEGVYFGEHLFMKVRKIVTENIGEIEQEILLPVSFPFNARIWEKDRSISSYIKSNTIAIGLNHSQFSEKIKKSSVASLASSKTLIGSALCRGGAAEMDCTHIEEISEEVSDEIPEIVNPPIYCAVIFFNDSVRLLGSCLKSIADNGFRIIAVDGAFKEYMKANDIYRDSSSDGCVELAQKMATHFIPAKHGGWDDEVEKRNAYLSLVPTGQYCMWLDTDELLPKFSIGELTADCYQMIEILHDEEGMVRENFRLRMVKKYDDLVYRYQHCRMYRLNQHVAGDLASGCVARSSGSTNFRYPFVLDTNGRQVRFQHFPFRRPKMKQEEKERFYKIRAEQKYPY